MACLKHVFSNRQHKETDWTALFQCLLFSRHSRYPKVCAQIHFFSAFYNMSALSKNLAHQFEWVLYFYILVYSVI